MTETATTDPTVFFSHNDVALTANDGDIATEQQLQNLLQAVTIHGNQTLSGFVPSEGAGLLFNVGAGEGIINGRWVKVPGSTQITLPNGVTRGRVSVRITKTASLVDDVVIADLAPVTGDYDTYNDTTAEDLIVATFTTAGGAISSWNDERGWSHGRICGRYVGDDAGLRNITLTRMPVLVKVASSTENIVSQGEISVPGQRRIDDLGIPDISDAHPGFWVRQDPGADIVNKKILEGSDTWDPAAPSSGTPRTIDVTVTGAIVGDQVLGVSHTEYNTSGRVQSMTLDGLVTAANTVTVVLAVREGATGVNIGSGTVRVLVYDRSEDSLTQLLHGGYSEDYQDKRTPQIFDAGFRVGHDATAGTVSLNATGQTYDWVAFF